MAKKRILRIQDGINSNQVEGCRGDFCCFDFGVVPAIIPAIDGCMRVREEEQRQSCAEEVARAARAAEGFLDSLSPVRLKQVAMNADSLACNPRYAAGARRLGDGGKQATRHSNSLSGMCEIPYKAVVWARQERVLVEEFLRQYTNGEDTEYFRGLDDRAHEELLIGDNYSGVYYRPVRVCRSCYMVYTRIDGARAQASRRASASKNCAKQGQTAAKDGSARGKGFLAAEGAGDVRDKLKGREITSHEGFQPRDLNAYERSPITLSLLQARRAMGAVSQGDISELKSFARPPRAVRHVVLVALVLLGAEHGDQIALPDWAGLRAAMSRSDFFSRVRSLDPRTVTARRIRETKSALESPGLDPTIVRPLSNAAGNLCLWVLGVLQANQWMTGRGHACSNVVPADDNIRAWGEGNSEGYVGVSDGTAWPKDSPFPQQTLSMTQTIKNQRHERSSPSSINNMSGVKRGRLETQASLPRLSKRRNEDALSRDRAAWKAPVSGGARSTSESSGPATCSVRESGVDVGFELVRDKNILEDTGTTRSVETEGGGRPQRDPWEKQGSSRVDAQAFACGKLANPGRATSSGVAGANDFVFSDGKTRLPYRVFGDPARTTIRAKVTACNFVVVHDFFDSLDKTDALFRPVTRAHSGCRVLAFNYPGQAGAVLRFPPYVAASSGGSGGESAPGGTPGPLETLFSPGGRLEKREPSRDVPNNSFIACKLHDLLQYVHAIGEMTLTAPFHLVGIGNGVAIAVAFALRYGDHPLYRSSLRSIVSINGFASVDPQLAANLHSSLKVFAALPPARADLSISFISRYMFSEDYLKKVGRNLALGIYTAVADPSLEDRQLVCKSALSHEDFSREVGALRVPTVLLQSTEDLLVDPSNVDPFLRGRTSVHHFWSHEFPQSTCGGRGGGRDAADPTGGSVYGRKGLTGLLRALSKPRGTFVAWVRAGHEVRQEAKRAVSDLLDALAKPTPEHLGVDATEILPEEGKAGAGAAMALYPSADFVARINIRCDEAKQKGNAVPSFIEKVVTPGREHHAAEEGRNSLLIVGLGGSQQPPSAQEGKVRGGVNPPPPAGEIPQLPSPFPKDIEIPPIPARIVCGGSSSGDGGANVSKWGSHGTTWTVGKVGRAHAVDNTFPFSGDNNAMREPDPVQGRGRRGTTPPLRKPSVPERHLERVSPTNVVRKEASACNGAVRGVDVIDRHRSSSVKYFSTRGAWEAGGGSGVDDTALSLRDSAVVQGAHSYDDSTWQTRASSDVGQRAPGYESLEDSPKSNGIPMDLVGKAQSPEAGTSEPLQSDRRRWAVESKSGGGAQAQGCSQGDLPAQEELDSPPASLLVPEPTGASQGSQTHTEVRGLREYLEEEARLKARWYLVRRAVEGAEAAARAVREQQTTEITRGKEARRETFANEDRTMIAELEAQLSATRRLLDANMDANIVREGLRKPPIRSTSADADDKNAMVTPGGEVDAPAGPLPSFGDFNMENSTAELTCVRDSSSVAEDASRDEIETLSRRRSMDEPLGRDQVRGNGTVPAVRRERPQRGDLDRAREHGTSRLERFVRGHFGRRQASRARRERANEAERNLTTTVIQTAFRGRTARVRVHTDRERRTAELLLEHWVVRLQRVGRRMLGQRRAMERRKRVAALNIERCYRGHLGRRITACARAALEDLRWRNRAALCIQARWRCNRAVQEYSRTRVYLLAAVKIQKVYRGVIGRKRVARKLEWGRTTPGPARLKLGTRLMEETQAAFEKQRLEIAALRNAERRAGIRASRIRSELDRSKKELGALEREGNEIDRIEDELSLLTHERCLLQPGRRQPGQTMLSHGESPSSAWGLEGGKGVEDGRGAEATGLSDPKAASSKNAAETEEQRFALDVKIQTKHAEWEKAKQGFEADFSRARDKVNLKRRELDGVITAVREMESTRGRKTMGLRRLQASIIELLREQTAELNSLKEKEKEKGIQMEVATVTSAAAAASAIQRIKDHHHEERCSAAFSRSEEIMRFQLVSASLGYFNSLNKLKAERDTINDADTSTAAAVASNAAAAALVRAPAASIPSSIKPGKALESGVGVVGQKVSVKRQNASGKATGTAGENLILPTEVETFLSQVRSGRLDLLERSLEKGFPVDAEDHYGNTALIVACQNCKMEICEVLLRCGADVNHGNSRGNTALHYAMTYDPRGAIVEMLISSGGDDTVMNKDGLTCYDCYDGLQAAP